VKRDRAELKETKAHIQEIPNPKKKQDARNKDPMTHPRHKWLNKWQNTQQYQKNP